MPESKLISIVGFVSQTSFTLFWDKAKEPMTFNFPQGSVSDFEVRKADDLASAFEDFLERAKLPPSQIYLIISADQVFESDFPVKDPEAARVEIDNFVKSVPFEHVASRIYRFGKGCRVMAINRELYETLQSVLESQENAVVAVTPANVLSDFFKSGLNAGSTRQLLGKADYIRQNSFVYQEEALAESEQKGSDPRKNKKLLALLVVFIALLSVLGILTYVTMFGQKTPVRVARLQTHAPLNPPPAQETPGQINDATASSVVTTDIKIQILNASGAVGKAGEIKRQLELNGFRNIQTGNVTEINGAKVITAFKPEVPVSLREQIVAQLLKSFPGVSSTEMSSSTFDIVITLTKNSNASSSAQIAP